MLKKDAAVDLKFDGKKYSLRVARVDNENGIDIDISECLDAMDEDDLFDYLYGYHISYFDGTEIKSGKDLKKSIEEIKVIAYVRGVIYICGEYWYDPEHGFSIKFPRGKFIKSEHDTYDYQRDEGKDVNFIPQCTILGQYSDYL